MVILIAATLDDYRLTEEMNRVTITKYSDMKQIAGNVTRALKDLNEKCEYFDWTLHLHMPHHQNRSFFKSVRHLVAAAPLICARHCLGTYSQYVLDMWIVSAFGVN